MVKNLCLFIFLSLTATGCIGVPRTGEVVTITSTPPGATVWIRDKDYAFVYIGTTPCEPFLYASSGGKFFFKIFMDGYEPSFAQIGSDVSSSHYANIVFLNVGGLIMDQGSVGAKWTFEKNSVNVTLAPKVNPVQDPVTTQQ